MRARCGGAGLVKGVSRRVIVVREPGAELFEEAIFIVREDCLRGGVSAEEVMRQARRAAGQYLRQRALPQRTGWRLGRAAAARLAAAAAVIVVLAVI